jgi:hypothetical protein
MHVPPGALELTMIGSKANSAIRSELRRPGFVPGLASDGVVFGLKNACRIEPES